MCDTASELRERANEKYGFLNTIHNMDVATAQEIKDAVQRICREHGYPAD